MRTWAHGWKYGHLLEEWLEPSLNMSTASHVSSGWSYGLIGIAFSLQGWLLAIASVIVAGAVVGSVLSEDMGARERTREA